MLLYSLFYRKECDGDVRGDPGHFRKGKFKKNKCYCSKYLKLKLSFLFQPIFFVCWLFEINKWG